MATYKQLSNGSKGEDVKKLQQTLIDAGYNVGSTGADGVYGKNTLAAVKQYQKDNGLAVDGIAGKNTLGSLYSSSSGGGSTADRAASNKGKQKQAGAGKDQPEAPTTPTTPSDGGNVGTPPEAPAATPTTSPGGFTYGDFYYDPWNSQNDPIIQEANTLLQQHMSNKLGDYTPVWMDEANKYLDEYKNRDPFSYDFNADALYNQYKDQYIQQGRLAMMDTMGQAQAMTGGYGSSYAQTVGQQAYNQQLNNLNEVIPELASMAYDRYNQEGQDLMNMYGIYLDRENQEYSRYQDKLNNWYTQLNYLTDNYNTAYDRGYDNYMTGYNTALNEYLTDRSEAQAEWEMEQNQNFTASENDKTREQTEKANAKEYLIDLITGTGYEPSAAELEAAGMTKTQAEAYKKAYTEGKTTGGTGGTGGTEATGTQYKDIEIGSTAYNTISTEVKRVTTIDQLKGLVQKWIAMGYDPDVINMLTADKADELMPKLDKVNTDSGPSRGIGNGYAGSTIYAVQK